MGRRRRNSVVPFVVLGAAVSIGVIALTASRFGWRRTKAEEPKEPATEPAPPPTPEPRFRPALRWDAPPEEYAAARAQDDPPARESRTSAEP
jgi:hypothetical protein